MFNEWLDPRFVKDKIDLSVTDLRDDLRGTDSRTLTDLHDQLDTKIEQKGTIAQVNTISDLSSALASQGGDELRVISI